MCHWPVATCSVQQKGRRQRKAGSEPREAGSERGAAYKPRPGMISPADGERGAGSFTSTGRSLDPSARRPGCVQRTQREAGVGVLVVWMQQASEPQGSCAPSLHSCEGGP